MIKTQFSIKDLENLSGIKSHTIRIWEKRYGLLEPDRTDTNIRTYDLESLQKILNVSYLNNLGTKISTIASLSATEIENQVRNYAEKNNKNDHAIQELKLAMVNFDQHLFQRVYESVLDELGFKGLFYKLFIPFLEELGYLWQSKTINIAHEHFISHLIKQKLLINLERVQYQSSEYQDKIYVLFLPENEMHDLGLLFLNYELLINGCNTVYLGASMTLDALPYFKKKGVEPVYITYITVQPTQKQLPSFLDRFNKKVAQGDPVELYILGQLPQKLDPSKLHPHQTVFKSIEDVMTKIPQPITT